MTNIKISNINNDNKSIKSKFVNVESKEEFQNNKNEMLAVDIKNLSFSYDDQKVLEHLNLTVNKSEFVAIIGQNGAGKSTLFNLILGNLKPFGGLIKLFGEDFKKKSITQK